MNKINKLDVLIVCFALLSCWVIVLVAMHATPAEAQLQPTAQATNANSTAPRDVYNTFQIKPQLLTGTSTVTLCGLAGGPPCGRDVYVCWMDVANGSTATTITVQDAQTSAQYFANAVALAANTSTVLINASPSAGCVGRWFPGGMTFSVANANTATIYIQGKWWAGGALF